VRRELHALGLRFRVHRRPLPDLRREADLVFVSRRLAVFVDGCFWHGCRLHKAPSKSNGAWWREKIRRNVKRDLETNRALVAAGWVVVRVWEHTAPTLAARRISQILRGHRKPFALTR